MKNTTLFLCITFCPFLFHLNQEHGINWCHEQAKIVDVGGIPDTKDPWGSDYFIFKNPNYIEVISNGPDKKPFTKDDINVILTK